MYFLSEALKVNNSLQELDLNNNNLGGCHDGVKSLSEALKINKTLKILNLWNNNLRNCPKGMKSLLETLKCDSVIQNILVCFNDLDKSVIFEIQDILARNKHNNLMKNSCLFGLLLPILDSSF